MSSPAHKIPPGNLRAVSWRNLAERGNWCSVQLKRGFEVEDGWRETENRGY